MRIAGIATTAYTLNMSTGVITFTTAPASGAVITADFSYYWRCRFTNDENEFEEFMSGLWSVSTLEFESVK
jgi:hypothetical protein